MIEESNVVGAGIPVQPNGRVESILARIENVRVKSGDLEEAVSCRVACLAGESPQTILGQTSDKKQESGLFSKIEDNIDDIEKNLNLIREKMKEL